MPGIFCFALLLLTAMMQVSRSALPETTAGRRVAAYIKAFNSGDEQVMRQFFTDNVTAASLQQRPIEARIEVYRTMLAEMGGIELRTVLAARDDTVTILVQTKRGEWFEFGFEFEPAAPFKLARLRVEDSEPPSRADASESSAATMTESQLIEETDKYLAGAAASDEFSGTVLIARRGKPIFQKAYGLASREHNVPNRTDTKFNLGSINKIFTQIAIGQLFESGKLSIDDKLGKHFPEYPNREAAEKITIRQLLDMSSGIGDFFGSEYDAVPKDRLRTIKAYLALFVGKPLLFEPGTKRQYSNGGYIVLGAIVEKVSGRDYYQYVQEHIFKPADMRDTDWYEADIATPNLAGGYTSEVISGAGANLKRSNIYTRPAKGSSAGGGYSTAPDLLKFVNALREGKLRVPSFRSESGASEQKRLEFAGLGIAGGAPGINAVLDADEERGYTTVVLSNYSTPSAERVARQIRAWISRTN